MYILLLFCCFHLDMVDRIKSAFDMIQSTKSIPEPLHIELRNTDDIMQIIELSQKNLSAEKSGRL